VSELHQERDLLLRQYWSTHPRFNFLKTAPFGSKLLDMGAGNGGLIYWKHWLEPHRSDLELFAVDLTKGANFDKYKDWQACNLDQADLKWDDQFFDSVLMSHVMEHLENPVADLKKINQKLKKGGQFYVEVPAPLTKNLPKNSELKSKGFPVTISNFFDDSTHLRTWELIKIEEMALESGFKVVQQGAICNRFLADSLFDFGVKNNDEEIATYGYWLREGWANFMILSKA
jgi:SAM-dependent methyltransferase